VADVEQIVYQAALRNLDQQAERAADVRTQAGTLGAVAAVVASFLGSRALTHPGAASVAWLAWLGLGTFVLAVACVLGVLWPREVAFSVRGGELDALLVGVTPTEAQAQTALFYDALHDANAPQLEAMEPTFRAGAVLVVLESVGFAVHLAVR
jgi:hypothetical protein